MPVIALALGMTESKVKESMWTIQRVAKEVLENPSRYVNVADATWIHTSIAQGDEITSLTLCGLETDDLKVGPKALRNKSFCGVCGYLR